MLFNRAKYKNFAIKQLKGRWSVPVVMTFITSLVLNLFSLPDLFYFLKSGALDILLNIKDQDSLNAAAVYFKNYQIPGTNLTSFIQLSVTAIFGFACISVYLKMSRSPAPVHLSDFFAGMNNWFRAIIAALWQMFWITLWSVLFIIPGIIKAISYSMTNFIVAEYKNISVAKALRISKLITKGHKADLFVMMLSFIPWKIIASITLGIGGFWLKPYYTLSFINAYHAMLKEAVETGKLAIEDLSNE